MAIIGNQDNLDNLTNQKFAFFPLRKKASNFYWLFFLPIRIWNRFSLILRSKQRDASDVIVDRNILYLFAAAILLVTGKWAKKRSGILIG